MTVVPFLEQNPHPSDDEIREAIDGNICRCTGYEKIIEAVQEASTKMSAR
jgi:carbon-monoxide dehydrogenase small subunit